MAKWPEKKVIVLWSDGTWYEKLIVDSRPIKDVERVEERAKRFGEDKLVAEITWEAGLKTNNQSSRLQPLTAIELRAFGVKCIELAREMEVAEKKPE